MGTSSRRKRDGMDFRGKVAVVVGGASEVGRAVARQFSLQSASVAIVDDDADGAEDLARQIWKESGRARAYASGLHAPAEVDEVVSHILADFGGIDILIIHSGPQPRGTAITTTEKDWDRSVATGLTRAFLVSRACLPAMIRAGGGSIVVCASTDAMMARSNALPAVVTQHGLLGLTRSLALDYGRHGVRVNCLCPGSAVAVGANPERRPAQEHGIHRPPVGRWVNPEEIASVILFLAGTGASFMTGIPLPVDGGLTLPVGGMAFQALGKSGVA